MCGRWNPGGAAVSGRRRGGFLSHVPTELPVNSAQDPSQSPLAAHSPAQYFYGSSETGEPFIIGEKLAGEDCSAWEAEYATFPKLKSLTLDSSGAKSIFSWSFERPKTSNGFAFSQLLLWLIIGTVFAFSLRHNWLPRPNSIGYRMDKAGGVDQLRELL